MFFGSFMGFVDFSIVSMVLAGIVSMIESTGVFFALADVCEKNVKV